MVVRVSETQAPEADLRAEELSLKLDVLKSLQMFRYLRYKELVRIMNISHTESYAAGDYVFREGEEGQDMYVMLSGTVQLDKGGVKVVEMSRGQHFGEMALVDRSQRSLSAVAVTDARLIAIKRTDFYAVIKKEPPLAVKLLWSFVQVLTERLRKTTSDLGDALAMREDGADLPPLGESTLDELFPSGAHSETE